MPAVDIDAFQRDGWLVVTDALDTATLQSIEEAVDEVESWAGNGGPGLHHFEQTDTAAVIARSEDFIDANEVLRDAVCHGLLVEILGALLGEPPSLFKEKVNYKQPGGGGFAPHQDATAYRFVDHHISCMVPLDPATEASGCLWVARGHATGMLATDVRGRLTDDVVANLTWAPVPLEPGDLLFFDSYTPHFSEMNRTGRARRAMYLTYNASSLGDHRARYYADKRSEFERAGSSYEGERVRISLTDDFLGRPVTP